MESQTHKNAKYRVAKWLENPEFCLSQHLDFNKIIVEYCITPKSINQSWRALGYSFDTPTYETCPNNKPVAIADIMVLSNDTPFFAIEICYTNPVDEKKLQRLKSLCYDNDFFILEIDAKWVLQQTKMPANLSLKNEYFITKEIPTKFDTHFKSCLTLFDYALVNGNNDQFEFFGFIDKSLKRFVTAETFNVSSKNEFSQNAKIIFGVQKENNELFAYALKKTDIVSDEHPELIVKLNAQVFPLDVYYLDDILIQTIVDFVKLTHIVLIHQASKNKDFSGGSFVLHTQSIFSKVHDHIILPTDVPK